MGELSSFTKHIGLKSDDIILTMMDSTSGDNNETKRLNKTKQAG
jgi:hypothetical protein